ncbi:MAG: hypothetical protein KAU83_03585 [Bacteroidales bacterium]|nr:hypothetical protein [Bacteroidales bacterium]
MKKSFKYLITFIAIVSVANLAYSNDTLSIKEKSWYVPDYAKLQFAGNIGFLSFGIGYELFKKHLQSDIFYGYVPNFIGGATIHTISQKNTFVLYEYERNRYIISPTAGFSTNFETGNNSFLLLPDKYPKGYYLTNAIHFTLFIGGKIHWAPKKQSKIKGLDFYVELGTVGTYLWYKILSKEIKMKDISSLALGITTFF